jgi:predicted nucleic acid-binding protein
MIILDTNVVSELMRERIDGKVLGWVDAQVAEQVYLTAINLSELLTGLELMPHGKRRQTMELNLDGIERRFFAGRILPYNEQAARVHALLQSRARSNGRAISFGDGQIAAIAWVHGFTVATRDTSPFEAAGVVFVNPWDSC